MIPLTHIHPMLVHFPIALVAIGFLADIASLYFKKEVCLSKTGLYLLVAGTLSAIAALTAGVFFTSEMSGAAGEVRDLHELFAWITVVILIVTSALRIIMQIKKNEQTKLKWIAMALYCLAAISVSITGSLGGNLVYNYMMPL